LDALGCPADEAELFTAYWSTAKYLAREAGIHENGVEDVAQEIILRYIAAGHLHRFDNTRTYRSPDGKQTSVVFASGFKAFGRLVARNFRDKQRSRDRELLLCDQPVNDEVWVELYGPSAEFYTLKVELDSELLRAHQYLSTIEEDGRNFGEVFQVMLRLADANDKVSAEALAGALGIYASRPNPATGVCAIEGQPSKANGLKWLARIRAELDAIGFQADWG
jgi:hypothetical protein